MKIKTTRAVVPTECVYEIENKVNSLPPAYRGTYKLAIMGKSRRAAINAKCLDCTCYQRLEIRSCAVTGCPLYPYRPYKAAIAQ
jgi:hypothetical protein